jgi:hypothetical protein
VKRAAQVLAFASAVDDGVADQILEDFELRRDFRHWDNDGPVHRLKP